MRAFKPGYGTFAENQPTSHNNNRESNQFLQIEVIYISPSEAVTP